MSFFCPECRAPHPQACGLRTYIWGECPVCLQGGHSRLLPCGHGLCEQCLHCLGGIVMSDEPSPQVPAVNSDEDTVSEPSIDLHGVNRNHIQSMPDNPGGR